MAGQTITVSVLADTKKFSSALNKLGDETGLNKLQAGIKNLGKVATIGAAAVGAAAVAWGVSTAKSLVNIERIGAQTDSVLKSTGGAAGKTRKDIDDLAGSIEKLSGIEAETVSEGENLLLTFTGIKGANFDRATSTMADMAVAMNKGSLEGLDMSSTAIQLGKALNDPVKGITALSKVGVSFTEQQKAQIQAMSDAGDVAGAQTIILDELAKEFGGSAEAAGGTALGKWAKIKNMFGEISERVLSFLMPAMQSVSDWILTTGVPAFDTFGQWIETKVLPAFQDFGEWFKTEALPRLQEFADFLKTKVLPVLQDMGSWIADTLVPALVDFGKWIVDNKDWLAALAITVGIIVLGIQAYIKVMAIWKAATAVATAAQVVFNAVMSANPIGLIILAIAALVAGLVFFFTKTETGKRIWEAAWTGIQAAVQAVASWFSDTLVPFLTKIWDAIYSGVSWYLNAIITVWTSIWNGVVAAFKWVWDLVASLIAGYVRIVLAVIGGIAAIPGKVIGWFGQMKDGIASKFTAVVDFVKGFPARVLNGLGNVGSLLVNAGKNMIQGLMDGITSAARGLADAVLKPIKGAVDGVKDFLGIHSPSRLFRDFGEFTMEGLAIGLGDLSGVKSAMSTASKVVSTGFDPNLTLNASGTSATSAGNAYTITINAGVGDPVEIGRQVQKALTAYEQVNGRR